MPKFVYLLLITLTAGMIVGTRFVPAPTPPEAPAAVAPAEPAVGVCK